MNTIIADICIIGGGSGGLSVAAGAAQLGATTILFERGNMGGDCLNTGCVPSKAMLAAGKSAKAMGGKPVMGISPALDHQTDFAQMNAHIHDIIASIAPHDSIERFEGLGVKVFPYEARFSSPNTVTATNENGDEITVKARYFVVATGSHPWTPPINGLENIRYLTNETIFSLTERPEHLLIIGGGPIGVEMAQAHRRLGAQVSLIDVGPIMFRDDPELVGRLKHCLEAEDIAIYEHVQIEEVTKAKNGTISIMLNSGEVLEGSHLLAAVGRRPNIANLALETANIKHNQKGIITDNRLRSSNKRVFAIGDVAGRHQFTHMASYHASIVIKNTLFKLPAKLAEHAVPYVTYTDPELAQTGISWPEAQKQFSAKDIRCIDWELKDNDRARAERRTEGLVRIITTKKGRILGASILAPHAGEMIHSWTLAIQNKMGMSAMANSIAPYPSWSEASKRAAGAFFTETLFSERTKTLIRMLMVFSPHK